MRSRATGLSISIIMTSGVNIYQTLQISDREGLYQPCEVHATGRHHNGTLDGSRTAP